MQRPELPTFGPNYSSGFCPEMATARAHIPAAPSAADRPVSRQFTRWRTTRGFEYQIDPESTLVKLAPSSYTPPQLLPAPNSVDTSERLREILIALQSWEGVVLDVGEASFVVRLIDAADEHADEEVTLSKDELSDFDLELLEPGAILYWTIGYRQRVGGARERVSRIRLRRLPAWTARQLTEAQERVATLARDLDW
jgi:hypothetical protein